MTIKYFYSKTTGKRISKLEYQRREKISKSLKARNKGKKNAAVKKLHVKSAKKSKRNPKRVIKRIEFKISRKRVRVKAYPRKKNPNNFFFADKRYYELPNPITIEQQSDIESAVSTVDSLIPQLMEDFDFKSKKPRILNVGYHLFIIFTSAEGEITEQGTVESVAYQDGFMANSIDSLMGALNGIKGNIETRFTKYLKTTGFAYMQLMGFETEISTGDEFN